MNTLAFISGLPGGSEVFLILFIILLLFGAKKLPELSRALGKSLGEFKKGKEDLEKELREVQEDMHEAVTTPEVEEKKEKAPAVVSTAEESGPEEDGPKTNEPA